MEVDVYTVKEISEIKEVNRSTDYIYRLIKSMGIEPIRMTGTLTKYYSKQQIILMFPHLDLRDNSLFNKAILIELPPKEVIFESKMNYDNI